MTAERSKKLAGGKRSATTGDLRENRAMIPEGSKKVNDARAAEFLSQVVCDPSGIGGVMLHTTGGAPPATTG